MKPNYLRGISGLFDNKTSTVEKSALLVHSEDMMEEQVASSSSSAEYIAGHFKQSIGQALPITSAWKAMEDKLVYTENYEGA